MAVATEAQAKQLGRSFVQLLGYRWMATGHNGDDATGDKALDFSAAVTPTAAGWQHTFVAETDHVTEQATRFWLQIGRDGTVAIGRTARVCQHNFYL